MNPSIQGVHQRFMRVVLLGLLVVLLLFGLRPPKVINPANSELASEVFDSIIILDSYLVSHSGSAYGLQVLVKKEADFIPVQIRLSDLSATYRTLSLTLTPDQHCPFADPRSQAAGIVSALKEGELIAYDSRYISNYQHATASMKSVDLIIDAQGELFEVDGLQVSGGCFWAQE
jgi:hypothetical protein